MKKVIVLLIILFNTVSIMAQFGVVGGVSVLKAFSTPKPYVGFHIGGEIPRDDQISIYGRISFYAKQNEEIEGSTYVEAINPITNPTIIPIGFQTSMNYTMIEGGNRYYIGDGYDSGFGGYGGGNLVMIFNSVKRKYDDFDEVKYKLGQYDQVSKGSIFNLGVGLGGGVKNTFAGVGTVYLDANVSYMLLSQASNIVASNTSLYSQLLFTFNVGFRKDIY